MKKCPHCAREIQDESVVCNYCGELVHDVETEVTSTPVYFPVSPKKLIVMSIFTLGLYQVYWFYENWRLIRENEGLKIHAGLRAIFAIFFCYSLFKRILRRAKSLDLITSANAGRLTAAWIVYSAVMTVISRFLYPFWIFTFLSVLFLLPVQRASNAVNEHLTPGHDKNTRFTVSNIVFILIGGMILFLGIIGSFGSPVAE